MERLNLVSRTPADTWRLGEAFGLAAQPGDLVLLDGPFGAGKTVFVQGLAAGLDVQAYVSSPSFIMINEHHGRLPLFHIDLYRIEGQLDPETLDALEDYLGRDGICTIEWPGLVPTPLRRGASELRFAPTGDTTREITIDTPSDRLATAARDAGATPAVKARNRGAERK